MATTKTPARKTAGHTTRKTAARKTPVRKAAARPAPATKKAPVKAASGKAAPVKGAPVKPTTTKKAHPAHAKQATKVPKVKKPKLVRDSFTIPKAEYEVIHALKTRGQKLGHAVKKSELLRAGIKLLATLHDAAFKAAVLQVPVIKTGRPKSAK
jgi:hypothetical protein